MTNKFNPFNFYGFGTDSGFEPIQNGTISDERIKEILENNVELKDKFLKKVEYKDGKLIFTVSSEEGGDSKTVDIDMAELFPTEENFATKADLEAKLDKSEYDDEKSGFATKNELSDYQKKGEYLTEEDLDGYALKTELPTDYLTEEDLKSYSTTEETDTKLSEYALKSDLPTDYLTEEDLDEYALKSELPTDYLTEDNLKDYATVASLSEYATLEDVEDSLSAYTTSEDVTAEINSAISASEAKIFGDGELAEAFDTIKEIGDYLKDNDNNVTEAINTAIATKLDTETYEADKNTFETKENAAAAYQPKGEYLTEDNLEGYATQEWVEGQNYITEHQSLTDYVKTTDMEVALEEKQNKGDYVAYTVFNGERKTISLANRDTISANTPKGGSQIAMVSDYDGLDFPVVEIGGQNGALVLNTCEDRVKVEVVEGGKRNQHSIATLDDVDSLKNEMKDYVTALLKNYTFKSDDDIAKTMKSGGDIIVAKDLKATSGYTLTKDSNIDLNGHTLDAVSNGNYGDSTVVGNGGNITISNGVIKPAENASVANASATIMIKTAYASHLTLNDVKVTGIHPIYLNSANESTTVTINGGEFYTTMPLDGVDSDHMAPAVYVGKGTSASTIGGKVTINGGTFGSKGVVNNFLLNVEDVLRKQEGKEPRNFIEVFGGKYWNFNPSNNKAEGEGTNFVADGYHVEQTQDGEDTIYTVVKD